MWWRGCIDFDSLNTRTHHQGPSVITQHSNAQLVLARLAGVWEKTRGGDAVRAMLLGEEIRAGRRGVVGGERGGDWSHGERCKSQGMTHTVAFLQTKKGLNQKKQKKLY